MLSFPNMVCFGQQTGLKQVCYFWGMTHLNMTSWGDDNLQVEKTMLKTFALRCGKVFFCKWQWRLNVEYFLIHINKFSPIHGLKERKVAMTLSWKRPITREMLHDYCWLLLIKGSAGNDSGRFCHRIAQPVTLFTDSHCSIMFYVTAATQRLCSPLHSRPTLVPPRNTLLVTTLSWQSRHITISIVRLI